MDRETWLKELTAERDELDAALDEERLIQMRQRRDQIGAAIEALAPLVSKTSKPEPEPVAARPVAPPPRRRRPRKPRATRRPPAPLLRDTPLPDRIAAVLRTRALPLREIHHRIGPDVSVNTVSARLAQLTAAGRIVKNGHRPAVYALP